MIFPETDEPVPLHFTQLFRERRALKIQIIRQLTAVERDIKLSGAPLKADCVQIGHDAPAYCLGSCVKASSGQVQILLRGDQQKIADKLQDPGLPPAFERIQAADSEEPDACRLIGNDVDQQRFIL